MRSHHESRRPRLAHARVLAGAAAILTLLTMGAAGCSDAAGPTLTLPAAPTIDLPPSISAPTISMAMSNPVTLQIPAIGVNSTLLALTLKADGTMNVPPDGTDAGWYTGAPTPGELGPAIIAGHVDWGGHPGVFYHLRNLTPHDQLAVTRQDGSTAKFEVIRVDQFPKDKFPTAAVYGDIDYAGLRLITCGGSFNKQAHSYDDNIIVFARLVKT